MPGTSRSGATIIGALLIGVSRVAAAEFTFFLAVIILIIKNIFNTNKTNTLINEQIDTIKNNNSFTNVTTTKQFKKTVYENGQKISEEETITHL